MLDRFLTTTVLGVGVFLGAIAVVAAPGVALGGAAFGALVGALTWAWTRGDAADEARTGLRGGLIVGAAATGMWLALTGFVIVLGPASGAVALLLSLGTCVVWRWRSSGTAGPRPGWRTAARDGLPHVAQHPATPRQVGPGTTPAPMPRMVVVPADLTTPQLDLAWQRTYFLLLDVPAGAPRAEVVHLRGRLLDEIERRDPDGFTRWLDTAARAGGDPAAT